MTMYKTSRLGHFLRECTTLVSSTTDEAILLQQGSLLLRDLVSHDDWLPAFLAQPHPQYYSQYLLYCDPLERFSVVSFIWGPGQTTPIHNHTVWGLIGMMRGAEISERYEIGSPMKYTGEDRLVPGMVDAVSPTIGDIHKVRNAFDDQVSISIHVYGSNIGATTRAVFDPATGEKKEFISGYMNNRLPNPWRDVAEEP